MKSRCTPKQSEKSINSETQTKQLNDVRQKENEKWEQKADRAREIESVDCEEVFCTIFLLFWFSFSSYQKLGLMVNRHLDQMCILSVLIRWQAWNIIFCWGKSKRADWIQNTTVSLKIQRLFIFCRTFCYFHSFTLFNSILFSIKKQKQKYSQTNTCNHSKLAYFYHINKSNHFFAIHPSIHPCVRIFDLNNKLLNNYYCLKAVCVYFIQSVSIVVCTHISHLNPFILQLIVVVGHRCVKSFVYPFVFVKLKVTWPHRRYTYICARVYRVQSHDIKTLHNGLFDDNNHSAR